MCSYSPSGRYLAAGSHNGDTTIWDIEGNRLISGAKKDNDSQCITAIQWHPNEGTGELAYMDSAGQFGVVNDIFDSNNDIERYHDLAEEADAEVDFGDCKFQFLSKHIWFSSRNYQNN